MPTVPRYLYEDAEDVHNKNPKVDERTMEAHQVQAVSLLSNESGQVKKIIYRFPPGAVENTTCNNKNFNDEHTGDFVRSFES